MLIGERLNNTMELKWTEIEEFRKLSPDYSAPAPARSLVECALSCLHMANCNSVEFELFGFNAACLLFVFN